MSNLTPHRVHRCTHLTRGSTATIETARQNHTWFARITLVLTNSQIYEPWGEACDSQLEALTGAIDSAKWFVTQGPGSNSPDAPRILEWLDQLGKEEK